MRQTVSKLFLSYSQVALGLVLLALLASPAAAQTVVNPTKFDFDHADYSLARDYEVGYYLGTASAPYWTGTVTKAQIVLVSAATSTYEFNVARPALGQFTAKLRANYINADGTTGQTDWSLPTSPFVLSLSVPATFKAKP